MRIRVLHFDGCPNSEATFELVCQVVGPGRHGTVVERIEVTSHQEAVRLRFLGSPTVQVNGVDIDPAARERSDFGMACRLYGTSGIPAAEMISSAIREATK